MLSIQYSTIQPPLNFKMIRKQLDVVSTKYLLTLFFTKSYW